MTANLRVDSELVTYFNYGIDAISVKDFSNARDQFEWCRGALAAEEADVFRALAWLDSIEDVASAPDLQAMYNTLPTWGRLLQAAGKLRNQTLPANTFEAKVMVIPDFNVTAVYRCPEVAALGYGSALVQQGLYDEARDVLASAERQLPMLILARMHLYVVTARWADVIETGQDILAPELCNKDGALQGELDPIVAAVANLYMGTAHAHLGNFAAAAKPLAAAASMNLRAINVEACYLDGLMDRAAGNERDAVTRFNAGQAFGASPKLSAAAADPTVVLKLTTPELISQRTSYWDRATEPDLAEVKEVEREERQSVLLAEAEAELDRQIGMAAVKKQVRDRQATARVDAEMIRRGKLMPGQSLHMAFTGPPGTGKTTMARVLAKTYAGIGLLTKEEVVEVQRDDLVGQHIGDTEAKTGGVINSALGGMLFIDEAYALVAPSLSGSGSNDFGLVALNTLLARMENQRDKLVVVIAGYEKDINQLLAFNEGFGSRFARRIRFDRYSPEEIAQIAGVMAEDRHLILPPESREVIASETRTRTLVTIPPEGRLLLDVAGNGRFARNIVEQAADARSARLYGQNLSALSDDELCTLTPEDVQIGVDALINPLLGMNIDARER